MQALVTHSYGSPDVLQIEELPTPTVQANEVLVAVAAAGVNAGDWHLLRGTPFPVRLMFGVRAPKHKVLGSDLAGRVLAVGSKVTLFQPGDAVFGNLAAVGFGAFAEEVAVPEETLVRKPANVSFLEAAAIPLAALTALQGLRDHGKLQAGQRVLVNGASGGVGSFAVQIAKALGAEVTGVCSTRNVEMVRKLGADHVIDYKREDYTQTGQQYDLILDAAAFRPLAESLRPLAPNGRYVLVGGDGKQMFQAMVQSAWGALTGAQRVVSFVQSTKAADLAYVQGLVAAGQIKAVLDRCYPLAEGAEALRYQEAGHANGKVVIVMGGKHGTKLSNHRQRNA